ncbi:MAG: SDR family oxidoreductase [Candidatus Dormibacteraeota bacterium]|nr:SDR family oxidoreductase [Candidatus Dormibacteraeota bacterium]
MARNVVITGAGTGIGAAVAGRFVADGERVFLTGRRRAPLESVAQRLGSLASWETCDVTEPAQIERWRQTLPERVDVLVNNAGGNTDFDRPPPSDLAELSAGWLSNLRANLLSAVLVTEALRGRLTPGGAVVSLGSIAADKGAGSYGAAKAAIASWNVDLARELGPRGVTANVVSPGYTQSTEYFRDRLTDQRRTRLIQDAATGRAGTPDDVAGAIHFLASGAARQITAQVLAVNGGAFPTR